MFKPNKHAGVPRDDDAVPDGRGPRRRPRAANTTGIGYGLHGLPTVTDLQDAVAAIEGAPRGAGGARPGSTATTLPLLALTQAGDHVLVTDAVYGPTRRFCNNHLARLGVEVTYYDPLLGAAIEQLFSGPTRAIVFTESPGSLTFCVQDIPAIAEVAHRRGALVITDNSWATPFGFRSFDHGVDVSVHAATKYIGGHSDVLLGAHPRQRGDVSGAAPDLDRHGGHRIVGRLLPRAARPAHAAAAPLPARRERPRRSRRGFSRGPRCAR